MPDINLGGILTSFLTAATQDSSVTKGIVSQPEETVEKATGLNLGNLKLSGIVPIIIAVLVAYTLTTGQAKSQQAAEKAVDKGKVDLSGMDVGNLLGNLDLGGIGSLLGLGGMAAAAPVEEEEEEPVKTTKKSSSTKSSSTTKKTTKKEEVVEEEPEPAPSLLGGLAGSLTESITDSITESITENIKQSVLQSVTGGLLGGTTTTTTKKKSSSGTNDLTGAVISSLLGAALSKK